MPFEVSFQNFNLNINAHCHLREFPSTANAPAVSAMPPANVNSNRIIQSDQPYQVMFHWTQTGGSLWLLQFGDWNLEVFVEKMGGGETTAIQDSVFKTTIPGDSALGFHPQQLNIPAGTLPPGVYRLICSMQFVIGGVPKDIAGFHDMGLFRVIDEA